MVVVAIRRSTSRPSAHLSRRAPIPRAVPKREEPTYHEVYEMLSEAAHLVSRAGRKLRCAQQSHAGFALQSVVDEIHEHIRQLPPSVLDQTAAPRHRRNDHCDS